MDRGELYAKLDKLFDDFEVLKDKAEDRLESLKDKAEDKLESLKDKAEEVLDVSDEDKYKMKLQAECAIDSAQRAACRGKVWLREKLTQAQLDIEGVGDKLEKAKAEQDKAAALRYVQALEKYAEDMLEIAQEAADEAADAVVEAVKARKEHTDKFGD